MEPPSATERGDSKRSERPSWLWWGLLLSCLGVAGYGVVGYALNEPGSTVHPEMSAVFERYPAAILAHVFGSMVALLIGPFQFLRSMQRRRLGLHKKLGWAYLILGVGVGGLAGLFLAQHAFGGQLSKLGFGSLAIGWLGTAAMGLRAIKSKDLQAHRRWMVRNFALTFAAVTLRIQLGSCFGAGLEFESFYPWLAWTSWVPNALLAEVWLRRS